MSRTPEQPKAPSRIAVTGWAAMAMQDAEAWDRIASEFKSDAERCKDPATRTVLGMVAKVYMHKAQSKRDEAVLWLQVKEALP